MQASNQLAVDTSGAAPDFQDGRKWAARGADQRRLGRVPLSGPDGARSEQEAGALHPVLSLIREEQLTASTLPASAVSRFLRGFGHRLGAILGAVVLPALAALLVLRYAVPSRFGASQRWLLGLLSGLGDRYPLFFGLAIFLAFSEVGRYWIRRLKPEAPEQDAVARGSGIGRARRLLIAFAAVIVLVFVTRSSVVATFRIVGPSMLPTLEIQDRVLVNRLAYGVTLPLSKARLRPKVPHRGDMVVFQAGGLAAGEAAVAGQKGDWRARRYSLFPKRAVSASMGGGYQLAYAGPYTMTIGRLTVRGRFGRRVPGRQDLLDGA